MRNTTLLLSLMAVSMAHAGGSPTFVDDFNDGNGASRWTAIGHDLAGAGDFAANFAHDYTADGIPVAPFTLDGSKIGMFMTTNDVLPASASAISAYPNNRSFSGNYSLAFDMWLNWFGTNGTTEFMNCGINCLDDRTNWSSNATSSGYLFAVTGEGGSARDYRVYRNATEFVWSTTNNDGGYIPARGPAPNFESPQEAFNPYFKAIFPSPEYPAQGAPGNHWVRVELAQVDGIIEWRINGHPIARRLDTTHTSGNVMMGYMDIFTSVSTAAALQFGLYDNVSVAPIILFNSYVTTLGVDFLGSEADLHNSDDASLQILSDDTTLMGQVELTGSTPVTSPTFVQVDYEGSVGRLGLSQSIALYNYDTSGFEPVVGGTAATVDTFVQKVIRSNAGRFVSDTGEVQAQVTWQPVNDEDPSQDGWLLSIDMIRMRAW